MCKILIIEDNINYRYNLMQVLQLEGYLTLEAENGLLGLQMIQQLSPNLILCDVDMPVMNGIEVLRRVKESDLPAKIPFIIITGHSDQLTYETAQDLGVEAYLIKTISTSELLSKIALFLTPNSDTTIERIHPWTI